MTFKSPYREIVIPRAMLVLGTYVWPFAQVASLFLYSREACGGYCPAIIASYWMFLSAWIIFATIVTGAENKVGIESSYKLMIFSLLACILFSPLFSIGIIFTCVPKCLYLAAKGETAIDDL